MSSLRDLLHRQQELEWHLFDGPGADPTDGAALDELAAIGDAMSSVRLHALADLLPFEQRSAAFAADAALASGASRRAAVPARLEAVARSRGRPPGRRTRLLDADAAHVLQPRMCRGRDRNTCFPGTCVWEDDGSRGCLEGAPAPLPADPPLPSDSVIADWIWREFSTAPTLAAVVSRFSGGVVLGRGTFGVVTPFCAHPDCGVVVKHIRLHGSEGALSASPSLEAVIQEGKLQWLAWQAGSALRPYAVGWTADGTTAFLFMDSLPPTATKTDFESAYQGDFQLSNYATFKLGFSHNDLGSTMCACAQCT